MLSKLKTNANNKYKAVKLCPTCSLWTNCAIFKLLFMVMELRKVYRTH